MSAKTKILRGVLKKMGVGTKKGLDEEILKKKFEEAVEAGKSPDDLTSEEVSTLTELGYEIEGDSEAEPEGSKATDNEEEVSTLTELGYEIEGDSEAEPEGSKATDNEEEGSESEESPKETKVAKKSKKTKTEKTPEKKVKTKKTEKVTVKAEKKVKTTKKAGNQRHGGSVWYRKFWAENKTGVQADLEKTWTKKFPTATMGTLHFYLWQCARGDLTGRWGFSLERKKNKDGEITYTKGPSQGEKTTTKAPKTEKKVKTTKKAKKVKVTVKD